MKFTKSEVEALLAAIVGQSTVNPAALLTGRQKLEQAMAIIESVEKMHGA
jgi:hypothetical protein